MVAWMTAHLVGKTVDKLAVWRVIGKVELKGAQSAEWTVLRMVEQKACCWAVLRVYQTAEH